MIKMKVLDSLYFVKCETASDSGALEKINIQIPDEFQNKYFQLAIISIDDGVKEK